MKRSLAHFAVAMGGTLVGMDSAFGAVSTDSRSLNAGDLFVALVGPNFDGHAFVAAAAERGAVAAVVSRRVAGSLIGGIAETQEMLDFCGKHNIDSDIELTPIQKVNEAYERVIKSDVRYRFVIDMASLKV